MDESAFNGTSLLGQYGVDAVSANPGGYSNGGAVMDALEAGSVDIAWLGSPPAIQKHLNAGTDVKIIAVANNEGSSIVAKEGINTIADLDQKVVATPGPSSIQHLLFMDVVESAGMTTVQKGASTTPNTVYWVQIPPVDQKAALEKPVKSGGVDAAVGWEPYGSDSILDGTAHILEWSGDVWPNHPCCVIAVRTAFAEANPEVVAKVLRAHIDANEWIADAKTDTSSENYTKLVGMAGAFANRDDDVIKSAINHTQFTYEIDDSFKTGLSNFTQSYIDLKIVAQGKVSERGYSSIDDFVNKFVDPTYLEQAVNVTKSQ